MKDYKKRFFTALGLLAAVGVLAGCSAKAAGVDENMLGIPQSDPERLTITVTCNSRLDHFAAAAEERFPEIRLVQDCYTGQYRISEHIARIGHNDFGDIIMVKAGHIPKIDMSGQLMDLSTQQFPANFNANVLQSDSDGHITLIPGPLSFNCNIYNKTLFEKAGLDPEQGPADWKELAEMSKKLETAGAAGYGFISDVWHYEALIRCNGGDTVNGDWTQATFNSPQGVELAEYLKKGIGDSNFKYYSGAATAAGDVLSTDVVNQKTAMWIASTAGLTNNMQLASDNGYEIGTAFIPKNTQNKVPTGGCNLVMTSRLEGREREAAAELIKFMTSKDSAVKNHIKTGYLPTRQSISTDERLLALYKETPQYQVALDQLKYGSGRPMAQGYMESAKVYTEAMDKIMSSDADIQAVLDQAAEDCNVLLK